MEDRSSKRRRGSRRSDAMPSAVHYVGYVEDDETPESIARKFEELDRIQAAARGTVDQHTDTAAQSGGASAEQASVQPPADDGHAHVPADAGHAAAGAAGSRAPPQEQLTDEQLMEVFKQTSVFTVRSAAQGNAALMQRQAQPGAARGGGADSGDDLVSDDEDMVALRGFWSDEDDQDSSEHWDQLKKLRKKRRSMGQRAPRERGQAGSRPQHDVVTHYNAATQAFIRRKVRPVNADAIVRIQMPPPPLPISWGRTVQPFVPPQSDSQQQAAEAAQAAAVGSAFDRTYQAVLVQPGWVVPPETDASSAADVDAAVATLAALPIERLCPVGFVFVWADKAHLHAIVKLLYRWRFVYVENLTWVHMGPNNRPLAQAAPHTRCSHSTLLMFRKDGLGKDIELRHQRKPDVVFDCVCSVPGGGRHMPEEVYNALETLLPTGKGQFLELWAAPGAPRDGWTQVVQVPRGRC